MLRTLWIRKFKFGKKDETCFTKIPLLIIKYEISPNMCNPDWKTLYYGTIKENSNIESRFNFQTETIQEVQLEIPPIDYNFTNYYQIRNKIFLSGGFIKE